MKNKSGCSATLQDVVIGTSEGQLYETSLEEKEKKGKTLKRLYELTELKEPFVGLQACNKYEQLGRNYIMTMLIVYSLSPDMYLICIFMTDGNHYHRFADKIFFDGSNTNKAIYIQRFKYFGGW